MRAASLAARITRLEQRHRPRRSLPKLAFAIHNDDRPEAAIQAFANPEGITVPRYMEEALNDLLARAWKTRGIGNSLFAVYAALEPAPEPTAPVAVKPVVPGDPFALAGIGRRATDKELNRLNAGPEALRLFSSLSGAPSP